MKAATTALRVVPKDTPAGSSAVLARDIPVNLIVPSETNPRKRFVEQGLEDLTASVKKTGVVQNVLVRPWIATEEDVKTFRAVAPSIPLAFKAGDPISKLVFGERRWRASLRAGRDTIPANIRELSDPEAEEIQMIENLQREDLHWLDAGYGYRHYLEAHGGTEKLEAIKALAASIHKSVSHVYGHVQYTTLIKPIQQLGYDGHITSSHADELCRLQPKDQELALIQCFGGWVEGEDGRERRADYKSAADIQKDKKAILHVSVRQLRRWITEHLMLDLKKAPFDPHNAELVPSAGACDTCPKRTGNNPTLFPDVRNGDTCTDQECFTKKKGAFLLIQIENAQASAGTKEKVVKIRAHHHHGRDEKDVLTRGNYVLATKDCEKTGLAVFVDADRFGELTRRCLTPNCSHHKTQRSSYRMETSPAERAQRSKQLKSQRIQRDFRDRLASTVKEKLPPKIGSKELGLLASFMQRKLSHDDARRLVRLHGWEEVKTKNKYSGMVVDFEKIIENHVKKMKPAELSQFVLSCTFLSDLYIPGYNPSESLESDSLLRSAATTYRVDHTRLLQTVKKEAEDKGKGKTKKATKGGKAKTGEGKKKQKPPQKSAKKR